MLDTESSATVGAHDAIANLGQLLDRVEQGEVIVITRHGVPSRAWCLSRIRATEPRSLTTWRRSTRSPGEIQARGVALTPADIKDAIDAGRP